LQTNATETKLELEHEIEPIIQVLVAVKSYSWIMFAYKIINGVN